MKKTWRRCCRDRIKMPNPSFERTCAKSRAGRSIQTFGGSTTRRERKIMHYEREDLGFSFDLPDGWRRDEQNLTLTFYGPNGGLGIVSELIQIQIGGILPQYFSPDSRETFLAEPGAQVSRTTVGGESNAVVLKKARDSEISVVRDGVHYTIAHCHDSATEVAIERLKQTARFPSQQQAQSALQSWSDPRQQAIARMLHGKAPLPVSTPSTQARSGGFLRRLFGR
jgi:predicted Zn-dependent protease